MTARSSDGLERAKARLRRHILVNWIFIAATSAVSLYYIVEHFTVFAATTAFMVASTAYLTGRMQGMLDLADGDA